MLRSEIALDMIIKRVRYAREPRDGPTIKVTEIQEADTDGGRMPVIIGTVIDSGSSPFPMGKPFLANPRDFELVEPPDLTEVHEWPKS